jgi:hypothetical protein
MELILIAVGIIFSILSVLGIIFPKKVGVYLLFNIDLWNRDSFFFDEKDIKKAKIICKIFLILWIIVLLAGLLWP